MENSKRGSIPMQEKLKLSKSQGASTPAEVKRMQNVPYASALGSIMYATTVKNILKYLRNTKDMFLVYEEAEYIAASNASKEAVWVRKFISGLSVVPTNKEPIKMYCDNTRAITIANESGITKGARHYRAKVHYLCEFIEFGDVKIEKVHTDDNLADPFTKALAFPKNSEHTKNIGMLPASNLITFEYWDSEVMNGLSECKASESNVIRIQVKDIVKEVEDHLKTYSSARMDISWYGEGIH
ncbi:hypothetical protein Tco_1353185 [Tanacetum coccineum]